jgi:hypothetical protein
VESEPNNHLEQEIKIDTKDNKYQEAKKRVQELRGFYTHLGFYVAVNLLLLLINIATSPGVLWFFWPLFGWGIGIAMHAVRVLGFGRWFGPDWEEKKIREIIQ